MPKRVRDREKHNRHQREWFQRNAEERRQQIRERKKEITDWLQALKATLSCERCGENHPACLQFHHSDPAGKDFDLGIAGHRGYGKERILAEIAKCEVLCANCHSKEHWTRDTIPVGVTATHLALNQETPRSNRGPGARG